VMIALAVAELIMAGAQVFMVVALRGK